MRGRSARWGWGWGRNARAEGARIAQGAFYAWAGYRGLPRRAESPHTASWGVRPGAYRTDCARAHNARSGG